VAHTYNPSYSGGIDQEDRSLKPAQANSSQDPISKQKKPSQKRAGGVAQGISPEFKPQYPPPKKNISKSQLCYIKTSSLLDYDTSK
jgi:hypothetical protein